MAVNERITTAVDNVIYLDGTINEKKQLRWINVSEIESTLKKWITIKTL